MMRDKLYIGIDVSKDWIDVAIHAGGKPRRLANTEAAIEIWIGTLERERIGLICFEPTGGYERILKRGLSAAKLPFVRVHPNEVVAFRRFRGVKAKTDPMDAVLLAAFCALELSGRGLAGAVQDDDVLRELSARRRQVTAMRHAESCRLAMADGARTRASIQRVIEALDQSQNDIEAEIRTHIAEAERLRAIGDILHTFKGVATVTVHTLLGELPELGRLRGKEIAALVGIAPRQNDSGKHQGRATIGYGRPGVRCALFNAARVAIQHNPDMRALYRRLTEVNKRPGKVAMTAVMRHILVILNAMVRDNQPWKGAQGNGVRGKKPRSGAAMAKGAAGATVQSQAPAAPFAIAGAGAPGISSRDETTGTDTALVRAKGRRTATAKSSRDAIQATPRSAGRKPNGTRAMSGAERQALWRARQGSKKTADDTQAPPPCERTVRLTRPRRWNTAFAELQTLVGEYRAWYEAMPEQLRDTPTGEALLAMTELDLDEIASIQLPKGFGRD